MRRCRLNITVSETEERATRTQRMRDIYSSVLLVGMMFRVSAQGNRERERDRESANPQQKPIRTHYFRYRFKMLCQTVKIFEDKWFSVMVNQIFLFEEIHRYYTVYGPLIL